MIPEGVKPVLLDSLKVTDTWETSDKSIKYLILFAIVLVVIFLELVNGGGLVLR